MNIEELFIKASRKKYRYSFKGVIGTEDLWDLSVENLDLIYKNLHTELEHLNVGESLLKRDESDETVVAIREKCEIIRYIYNVKQKEKQEASEALERAAMREKLLREKERRNDDKIISMSDEELDAALAKLN